MPLKSLEEYRMIEEESNTTISAVDERFAQLASVKDDLEDRLLEVTDRYNLVEASASMLQNKGLAALQGFCPEPRVAEISAAAKANGWGIRVEDPTDEDNIPTLLGYNKLSRPMQCLYDIIGISPGYNEVDVSSVFLCFFSLFFAMIVGDMAYGLLFLGLAMFARSKMPKASSAGFHFVYLMSWATIIWGAINANFLGLTPELAGWSYYLDIANYNFIPEGVRNVLYWIRSSAPTDPTRFEAYKQFCETFTFLPASFVPKAAGASQMQHIQLFCFCIAVVHLSIAHAWNVVVRLKRKSSTFMAQVGWLMGAWVMFFLACNMVLGIDMPKFVIPMFIVEVVLLVLFTVPPSRLKQDFISIPMLVLDIVNSFTDVISYIRLFAVGMSGAAIAEAFNGMLSPLFGSAVGVAGAALVLLGVHGLNIALAVMGVAVHAVRLNTLEFSNGLGLEWSGFALPNTMVTLAKMGAAAALGIAAMGSALGCGTAGMSAITMWKKAYAQGKSALFTLLVFVGAPISQTIYGMLLMNFILSKAAEQGFTNWGGCLGAGIFGGLGMMASAWYQGKSAAVACDALGETGKGMVNYLMVLGIVETVALFVLVFSMMVL